MTTPEKSKWNMYFIPTQAITPQAITPQAITPQALPQQAITLVNRTYTYENVNKNPKLRESITLFYYNKIIKWVKEQKKFAQYKKMLPFLQTKNGYTHVYKLLRVFVKMYNVNWYDLKRKYIIVKDYLQYKLSTSHK